MRIPERTIVGISRDERRRRFRDAVMLIYLISAALFVFAGVLAALEALGLALPQEGWAYTIGVMLVYGVAFAAIPAVLGAVVVIARLWRDPEAWIPAALWLVTAGVAVAEASRPTSPDATPGEPSGSMEYVILGCLCLYTLAAGYSGIRWLVRKKKADGPVSPEIQR